MPAATVLFELTELASFLQESLDTESATLARRLATGAVQRAAGHQEILFGTSTITLPVDGYVCELPQRPVVVNDDNPLVVSGRTFGSYHESLVDHVGHRLMLFSGARWDTRLTVTYSHGFQVIPDGIVAIALAVAGRIYNNVTGLRSESIDDHSQTWAGTDEELMAIASVLESEKSDLLDYFGRPV